MADDLNALLQANRSSSVLQGIANPPLVNPLAAMNSAVSAASGVYNLRQAQAQEALGDAYRQAVDPATGRFDPLKFNQLAAQNDRTSMAAGKGIESSQTLQGEQFKLGAAERGAINSAVTAALASDDGNLKQSVIAQIQRLRGIIPSDRLDTTLLHLSSDPAQLRQQLETIRIGNQAPNSAQTSIYGAPFRQTGPSGNTIGGTADVRTGAVSGPPQAGLPLGLDPAAATELVSVNVPNGPPIQMPRELADRAVRTNPALQALNPGYSFRSGQGGAPGQRPWTPDGRYPQPQQGGSPPTPAPAAAPPAPAQPQFQSSAARADAVGSPAQTGLPRFGSQPPPGFGTQQEAGTKAASAMETEATAARSQLQPLLTAMLPELEAVKNTGAGQKSLSFIQQMAIRTGMVPPKFDPTNPQASVEALGKVFARYQAAQLGAMGAQPSDSRQTLAEATSPSMTYSSAGNRRIVHSLQGNNDALDVMYSNWMGSQTRANNPGNFNTWRETFTAPVKSGEHAGARFDPTVFAVARMPQPEAKEYLANLQKASPGDADQLRRNWKLAAAEGWIRPNAAGTATTGY